MTTASQTSLVCHPHIIKKYANQKTMYTKPTILIRVRQLRRGNFCRKGIFVTNSRNFLVNIYRCLKCDGVQKVTNMSDVDVRHWVGVCIKQCVLGKGEDRVKKT